jgi:hypothetical protein
VLISYENAFSDVTVLPRVWVVPFDEAGALLRHYAGNMTVVSRAALNSMGTHYENAWNLLQSAG